MNNTIKKSWCEFTPEWSGFNLTYHVAGYFSDIPMLQIYFIWGKLFLYLPWRHYKKVEMEKSLPEKRKDKLNSLKGEKIKKKYKKILYEECDPPSYGVYFYMNQLVFNLGSKTKSYDMPWNLEWIRTSCLRQDGNWEHETKKNRNMDFWDKEKWKNILFTETHPYQYITKDNKIQNCLATITIIEREWRWKWFKWLKNTQHISRDLEITFDTDIGERKGTWKGGCTGCSYKIKPNETPLQALKRMEKEREF